MGLLEDKVVLVGELRSAGAEEAYVQGDVSDPASARGIVEEVVQRHGRIDGLVNSAGLTRNAAYAHRWDHNVFGCHD